jgi:hypothetical protein
MQQSVGRQNPDWFLGNQIRIPTYGTTKYVTRARKHFLALNLEFKSCHESIRLFYTSGRNF